MLLYDEHTWGAYNSVESPDLPFVRDQWRIKHSFAMDADRQSRELLAETVFSPGLTIATKATHVNTITVYNTNSWPRTDLVVLPRELPLPGERVEDAAGKVVPSQRLSTGEFAFLATDVPPLAGKPFTIKAGSRPTATHLQAGGTTLAGADLTVSVDPKTGGIASLRSRRLGVELVDRKAATAVNDYFYLLGNDLKNLQRNGPVTISVKESGPLVASLLVDSDAPGCNHLSREIRMIEGLDRVDLINRVDKKAVRAKEGVHFGFGFAVPDAKVRLDVGWAVIRPNKDQIPGSCFNWFSVQRFVDVSNAEYGVTWAPLDAPIVETEKITGILSGSEPDLGRLLVPRSEVLDGSVAGVADDLLVRDEQPLGDELLRRPTGPGGVSLLDLPARRLSRRWRRCGSASSAASRCWRRRPRTGDAWRVASDGLAGRGDRDLAAAQPGRQGPDRAAFRRVGQGREGRDPLGCPRAQGRLAKRPERADR